MVAKSKDICNNGKGSRYVNPVCYSDNAFEKPLGWPQGRRTDNEAGKVNGYRPGPCAKTDFRGGDGLITFRLFFCYLMMLLSSQIIQHRMIWYLMKRVNELE
jgi:hypothetical protein